MKNWNPHYNDVYFTPDEGINESRHVFLQGTDLVNRWKKAAGRGDPEFCVLETGFGTGLNFFLTVLALWEASAGSRHMGASAFPRLRYISVEKYPLNHEKRLNILSSMGEEYERLAGISSLIPEINPGWNRLNISSEESSESGLEILLELFSGDISDFSRELEELYSGIPGFSCDAVYLDGHSPEKNPDMWTPELFNSIRRICAADAVLSTFTAAGSVKQALRSGGFSVTRKPGYGKKRHMVVGRPKEDTEESPPRAPRNKTLTLSTHDRTRLAVQLHPVRSDGNNRGEISGISNGFHDRVFHGDSLELCRQLPDSSVNLIVADPPYAALNKQFGTSTFSISDPQLYCSWLEPFFREFSRILSDDGSIYVCGDWRGAGVVQPLFEKYFILRNRITWEREKGRGARSNWKNSHEDIWYGSKSQEYCFNLDDVKILRSVKAPYTSNGKPKDWIPAPDGGGYRFTHPGNSWTDLTVPFWSMPENTDHPTQKPEKLLARIILASSKPGDLVFDPFLGSGTTAVAAYKLDRTFCAVELEEEYCLYALKRLEMAAEHKEIQGVIYHEGRHIFLHRNSNESSARKALKENVLNPDE